MIRVGVAFDAHAFAEGRPLVLAGVTVGSSLGLAGHSDADVISHAMAEALLGAAGLGDLGEHFPNTERYKGVSSLRILMETAHLLEARGWAVGNIDASVIAEAPRLAPHRAEMEQRIADALSIEPDSVSIKATTSDKLGFTGRAEGIAAIAVALIEKP